MWIVDHVNYMDHMNHAWVCVWIFCCVHQSTRTILQFSHRLDNYSCAVNLEIKQRDLFSSSKLVFSLIKNPAGILIGIVFNLWISVRRNDILTVLSLEIHYIFPFI